MAVNFKNLPMPLANWVFPLPKSPINKKIKGKFIHLDTWRLQHLAELDMLNLQAHFKPKNIIAVEWADRTVDPILKISRAARAKIITVKISVGSSLTHRLITVGR